jgi:hypothetical protein
MTNIDFKSISAIIDADFTTVSEANLRTAIKTFQENYKNLPKEVEIASKNLSDEDVHKLLFKN